MKQIIEERLHKYRVVNINCNTSILNYLKERNFSFRLKYVSDSNFKILLENKGEVGGEYGNFIAGYVEKKKDNFRDSGGLRLLNPVDGISGSFVIENKRIVYDASYHVNEEYSSYVYKDSSIYYTTMSMQEVLLEELKRKRAYLVYMGEKLEDYKYISQFERISKEELIELSMMTGDSKLVYSKLRKYH